MNGQLAHLIALSLHGSAWLATGSQSPLELEQNNSTFRFVRESLYVDVADQAGRQQVARSAADWLSSIRSQGVRRLWLWIPGEVAASVEPHLAAGFSNGVPWALLAQGPVATVMWSPSWSVTAPHDPESRIWTVRLTAEPAAAPVAERPSCDSAGEELAAALKAVQQFAGAHDLDDWASFFARASNRLTGSGDLGELDLAPIGAVAPSARLLLNGACAAWAFGGMGSWNDLGFEDADEQVTYQTVTSTLYAATLRAALAATNADLRV